jgi:hypothetical protein
VFALGGVIAWGSKLMATIAASSMESEYMSAYHLGQQLLWYRGLMKEIGYPIIKPTPFFMDASKKRMHSPLRSLLGVNAIRSTQIVNGTIRNDYKTCN